MTLRKASHTRRSFQKAYRFANIKSHLQITPAINTVQFFWVCFNKIIGKMCLCYVLRHKLKLVIMDISITDISTQCGEV